MFHYLGRAARSQHPPRGGSQRLLSHNISVAAQSERARGLAAEEKVRKLVFKMKKQVFRLLNASSKQTPPRLQMSDRQT